MEKLRYLITINASKQHVWATLLSPETYTQWVKAFSENSQFIGEWKEGAEVRFVDPTMGGTKARLEVFSPYDRILAKHIATITKEGIEETEGEMTETWIGTTEEYLLQEENGATELAIVINTHPDFKEMFDTCWPKALETIKRLSEKA